ncbi:unnamed protein product [Auanema sp. JU1783]|nr:unnamed protein product [Auanema sp. JU1783]
MAGENILVPLQRPSQGSAGKKFDALVNYFKIPNDVIGLPFVEYNVDMSYEIIDPDGIIDDKWQIPNRTVRRQLFWNCCDHQDLVIYDDWKVAFFAGGKSRDHIKIIKEIPLGRNRVAFVVIKPLSRPFCINITDQHINISLSSEMLLKALVTQGTRVVSETGNFFSHGGAVYPVPGRTRSAWDVKIHNDIRAWVGLYAGVRSLSNRDPVINYALTHKLFHQMDIDLVTFFVEVLHSLDESKQAKSYRAQLHNLAIKPEHTKRLNIALKDLKVRVKEKGKRAIDFKKDGPFFVVRHGVVNNVLEHTANTFGCRIRNRNERLADVYAHMGAELEYPNLPIIEVVCQKKKLYLPMEVLHTYDTPTAYNNCFKYFSEQKRYIERVSHNPTEYVHLLLRTVEEFSEKAKKHGFREGIVDPVLLEVQGRRLKLPKLLAKNGSQVQFHDDYTYRVKELNKCPEQKVHFSLIHVLEGEETEKKQQHIRLFYETLKPKLEERGIKVSDSSPRLHLASVGKDLPRYNSIHSIVEEERTECIKAYGDNFREKLAPLFLIIFENMKTQYGYVKSIMDTEYGFANQGIDEATITKAVFEPDQSRSIYYNLTLKINAKLGGLNIEAENVETEDNNTKMEKLMYIGMDCTHPSDVDNVMKISLAAMTGSTDSTGTKYNTEVYAQLTAKEQIDYFHRQFTSLIFKYKEENGYYPEHIVVYRDGVSNSQLLGVAADEIQSMRGAWSNLEDGHLRKPTFTYIVLQKRHGTRFFVPKNHEYQNVKPGSVFDSVISSPILYDFWLCSQYSEKHTIRPGHYTVVYDNWNLPPDTVYEMTYRLCFLNARCRKPISLPVCIHYADIACSKLKEKYKALVMRETLNMENRENKETIESALKTHNLYPGMPYI